MESSSNLKNPLVLSEYFLLKSAKSDWKERRRAVLPPTRPPFCVPSHPATLMKRSKEKQKKKRMKRTKKGGDKDDDEKEKKKKTRDDCRQEKLLIAFSIFLPTLSTLPTLFFSSSATDVPDWSSTQAQLNQRLIPMSQPKSLFAHLWIHISSFPTVRISKPTEGNGQQCSRIKSPITVKKKNQQTKSFRFHNEWP